MEKLKISYFHSHLKYRFGTRTFGSPMYLYVEVFVVAEYFCPGSVYICNELIEETARRRKLIFGMSESFGYGSTKF